MESVLLVINAGLVVYGFSITYILIRNKRRETEIMKNSDYLREWIKVHKNLEKASGALLEIKKLDDENLIYWGNK
jgi:hypothetical protein